MKRKWYTFCCKKCDKEYSLLLSESELKSGRYSHHCSRSCANSRNLTNDVKNKISYKIKNRIDQNGPWGALLLNINRTDDELKQYTCKECGKTFNIRSERNIKNTSFCSKECSINWIHKNTGGYRRNAGKGKHGWYKGIWCDSSWELAFVIYHIDHGLSIKRCTEKRIYEFEGKQYTYNPDFVTDDGIIEIKGYTNQRFNAKINSSPDVKVLFKNDIQYILDYVHNKYGINFISLYDGSNPKLIDSKKKFRWVHKGKENKRIHSEKLQEFIDNGYVLGKYIKSKNT